MGAYIAAGSAISKNVPAESLGVARSHQVNKKGWAVKRRRELAAAAHWKPTKRKSGQKTQQAPLNLFALSLFVLNFPSATLRKKH